MKTFVRTFALGICLSLLTAEARAEGWQMPNLNPFSGTKTEKLPTSSQYKSSTSKSWLPSWKSKPSAGGPSMWEKTKAVPGSMLKGTQNAVNSINPFKASSKPVSQSNHYMSGNGGGNAAEKKSSWFPWGEEEKPAQRPQTVSDWIALPRAE